MKDSTNKPLGRRYKEINVELDRLEVGSPQWNKLYDEQSKIESVLVDRNLKGIELEKKGKIQEAISLYEQNIADEFDGSHPYDRLAVIYRKQKRIEDEIRVLEQAIKVLEQDISSGRADAPSKVERWQKQLAEAKNKRHRTGGGDEASS
jgi:tetratricopeptide (TPR) repeat protein